LVLEHRDERDLAGLLRLDLGLLTDLVEVVLVTLVCFNEFLFHLLLLLHLPLLYLLLSSLHLLRCTPNLLLPALLLLAAEPLSSLLLLTKLQVTMTRISLSLDVKTVAHPLQNALQ
jgi:hypothetical protein